MSNLDGFLIYNNAIASYWTHTTWIQVKTNSRLSGCSIQSTKTSFTFEEIFKKLQK